MGGVRNLRGWAGPQGFAEGFPVALLDGFVLGVTSSEKSRFLGYRGYRPLGYRLRWGWCVLLRVVAAGRTPALLPSCHPLLPALLPWSSTQRDMLTCRVQGELCHP